MLFNNAPSLSDFFETLLPLFSSLFALFSPPPPQKNPNRWSTRALPRMQTSEFCHRVTPQCASTAFGCPNPETAAPLAVR